MRDYEIKFILQETNEKKEVTLKGRSVQDIIHKFGWYLHDNYKKSTRKKGVRITSIIDVEEK